MVASLLCFGCSSTAGERPRKPSKAEGGVACAELATPPTGQCRNNADCSGDYVECVFGAPTQQPRMTGTGGLYGTDGKECVDGYGPATCPPGETSRTRTAANRCPVAECIARCTDSSCATDETCDLANGLCQPISCADSWKCGADEKCEGGPTADKHGCGPRCPGYGKCRVYGPPIP